MPDANLAASCDSPAVFSAITCHTAGPSHRNEESVPSYRQMTVYLCAHWQAINQLCNGPDITLTEWIAIMLGVAMIGTQLPTLHSLRGINGVGMLSTYLFCLLTIIIAIYQGGAMLVFCTKAILHVTGRI